MKSARPKEATLRGPVSQELDKPKFAFFFFFWFVCLSWFAFLFVFVFTQPYLTIISIFQHSCEYWAAQGFCLVWVFICSFFRAPGISQRRRSRGLVVLLFLLRIPGTKHCAESAPIVAIHWQQKVEGGRPRSLPGCADLRNEVCTRSSPEAKGWKGWVPACFSATMISCLLLCRPVRPVQTPVHYKPNTYINK